MQITRRGPSPGIILFLALLLGFFSAASGEQGQSDYASGNALISQGRYQEAASALLKAVDLEPNNGAYHNALGFALSRLGEHDKARWEYEKAIELDPRLAEAHYNLGVLFYRQKRFTAAADSFDRAIAQRPGYARAHNNLGMALLALGDNKRALESFQRAVSYDPNLAEAHFNLGLLYESQGRGEEAFGSFKRAVEIDPNYARAKERLPAVFSDREGIEAPRPAPAPPTAPPAAPPVPVAPSEKRSSSLYQRLSEKIKRDMGGEGSRAGDRLVSAYRDYSKERPGDVEAVISLGLLLNELGRPREAKAEFEKAVALAPDLALSHVGLTGAHINLGELDEADKELAIAERLEPDFYAVAGQQAMLAFVRGDARKAVAYATKAVGLDPAQADLHDLLGGAYLQFGEYQKAVEAFKKALAIQPDNARFLMNLGAAYVASGDSRQGLIYGTRAVEKAPNDSRAHFNLGVLYSRAGQEAKAMEQYRRAIRLDPRNLDARHNLAAILLEEGKISEGAAELKRILEIDPGFVPGLNALAYVYAQQGRNLPEALAMLDRALEKEPDNPTILDTKAWVLHRMGRSREALKYIETAASRLPDNLEVRDHLDEIRAAVRAGKGGG